MVTAAEDIIGEIDPTKLLCSECKTYIDIGMFTYQEDLNFAFIIYQNICDTCWADKFANDKEAQLFYIGNLIKDVRREKS